MAAMRLTRSSRSTVALLTAILLLLCQTAFAANACAHSPAPASADATTNLPCHGADDSGNAPGDEAPGASGGCGVSKALADSAKIPVFASTDLPAVIIAYPLADAAIVARAPARVSAVCASPPLTILHCRFIN